MKKRRVRKSGIRVTVLVLSLVILSGCMALKNEKEKEKTKDLEIQESLTEEEPTEEASNTKHVEADIQETPGIQTQEKKPGTESVPEDDTEEPIKEEPAAEEPVTEEPEKFAGDIASLDNTPMGWGPGVHFDEKNRPEGATAAQDRYGKYCADFVKLSEGEEKTIYLTFDEGYENGYTSQILDVLKEKNCPAVFFVTMPYAKQQPELIQRMIDEGHMVGNHSVTHPADGLPSQTKEQQEQELMELHAYMKENFGYEMTLFRYPAGKYSEQSLAIVQNLGYTSVFWSFAYKDWDPEAQPGEAESLAKLKERLHPGAIYLLHAVSETNTNILGQFIDEARASGYEFVSYN